MAFARELDDPWKAICRLHDGPDLIWASATSHGQPAWVPTRFAMIQDIMMDAASFSSVDNIGIAKLLGVDWRQNPLEFDPPEHMAYRQILQPWFQPSAINKLESMIRRIASELIDSFADRGECEFVEEFSAPFPSRVFLEMTGLPHDMLPQFFEWEHKFTKSRDPEVRRDGILSIVKFLEAYLEDRRGDERGDLITGILTAGYKGRPLNAGEIMGMCTSLYFGGLDTVVSSLGWYLRHLALDQGLQAKLRERPDLIPAAVDEMLRLYGVVGTHRTVTRDMEFDGVALREGDRIMLPTYFASRDPRQFENPHEFEFGRKTRHLTLATGVHNCLGAHLARREIKVVFEEWLSRFREIRIPEGETTSFQTEGVWSTTRLPLTWKKAD
jgi:cytochrome P450